MTGGPEPSDTEDRRPWWRRPPWLAAGVGVIVVAVFALAGGGSDDPASSADGSTVATSSTSSSTTTLAPTTTAAAATTTSAPRPPPTSSTTRLEPPTATGDWPALPPEWVVSEDGLTVAAQPEDLTAVVTSGPRVTRLEQPLTVPIAFSGGRMVDAPRRVTVGDEDGFALAIETDDIVRLHVYLDRHGFLLEAPADGWVEDRELLGSVVALDMASADPPTSTHVLSRRRDDSRVLSVRVPEAWTDKNGQAWRVEEEVVGPALSVSPDLERFIVEWDTPGVFVATSDRLRTGARRFLEDFRFETSCSLLGRIPVLIDPFDGFADVWAECGGVGSTFYVIAALDGGGRLLFVEAISTGAAEDAVFIDILGSIRIATDE